VSLEYVLLAGVNDTPDDACRLAHLAYAVTPPVQSRRVSPGELARRLGSRKPFHVNLIQFNPVPASELAPTPWEQVERFQSYLKAAGVMATYRRSRGAEVAAACGMLAGSRRGPARAKSNV